MLNSNKAVKKKIEEYNVSDIQQFIDLAQYAARHTLEEYLLLARNIVTMAYKRDLYRASTEIQSYCFNDSLDLSKTNTLVNNRINKLTEDYLVTREIVQFGERVDSLWQTVVNNRTESGVGIPSKFPSFNEYFTYEAGELILLQARMKRGKSAVFLNECIHKLKHGCSVLYVDTEMSSGAFLIRMLANLTGVEVKRIKNGNYTKDEEAQILKAKEWIKGKPFVHMYLPTSTDEELYSIHKILKYKNGLNFSIYDYIKSDATSTSDNYNILGQKTDFLKNRIAGELEIAVLAGAQLNRNMETADSDKIARYVSTSIIWREKSAEELQRDGLKCGNFCATINLNRNGNMMTEDEYINFNFNGDLMRISEAEKSESIPFTA